MQNENENELHSKRKQMIDRRTTEELCTSYTMRLRKALIQVREIHLLCEAKEKGETIPWFTVNGNIR